jgi:hypothetical protein
LFLLFLCVRNSLILINYGKTNAEPPLQSLRPYSTLWESTFSTEILSTSEKFIGGKLSYVVHDGAMLQGMLSWAARYVILVHCRLQWLQAMMSPPWIIVGIYCSRPLRFFLTPPLCSLLFALCSLLSPDSLNPIGGLSDRECRVRLDDVPYGGAYPAYGYEWSIGGGVASQDAGRAAYEGEGGGRYVWYGCMYGGGT